MNRAISFLKRLRLDRVFVIFLAGVLLIFTTACSGAANAGTAGEKGVAGTDRPGVSGEGKINGREGYQTELYDPIQPKQGGMNEYSDVDPRTNKRPADAKAKSLVDRAERNVIDKPDEVGSDLKESSNELGRQTRQTIDTARENTRQAGEDLKRNTRQATDAVKDKAGDTVERTQQTLNKAGNAIDRNTNSTSNFLKDRANDAIDSTQKALGKTQDAINK